MINWEWCGMAQSRLMFRVIQSLLVIHDDVIEWKHFPRHWPFVRGIYRSPVDSPHQGQWREALVFSLVSTWTNGWANNRDAGDLRRHRAHYDVIVMKTGSAFTFELCIDNVCKHKASITHFVNFDMNFIYRRLLAVGIVEGRETPPLFVPSSSLDP